MTRVFVLAFAISLVELGSTAAACAQAASASAAASSTPQARRRAARLTEQAEADYGAQRYEAAAVGYQRAFAVVPEPDLLFNIGQCQRQLGRTARALHFFRAYLRLRPDAPQRPLVEELIVESERKLAANALSPQRAAQSTATAARPTTHLRAYHEQERADSDGKALYEQWWFWTGVGVLTAGATAALVVALDQPSASSPPNASLGSVRWE